MKWVGRYKFPILAVVTGLMGILVPLAIHLFFQDFLTNLNINQRTMMDGFNSPQNFQIITFIFFPIIGALGVFTAYGLGRSEKNIRNREKRIQNLMDGISDGIVLINGEGKIMENNLRFSEKVKIQSKSLAGVNLFEYLKIPYSNINAKKLQRLGHFEAQLSSSENETFQVEGEINPLKIKNKDQFVVTLKDMSGLKEQAKIIEDQRAQIIESAKLASLGEMAGGIAHEINNPLAIINGSVFMIKAALSELKSENAEVKNIEIALDKIDNTVLRISRIIKGLRTLARDTENDPAEPARIKDIVEDALNLCGEKTKSFGVQLTVDFNGLEDFCLICQRVQLAQVLLNLLNNSFDAVALLEDAWIRLEVHLVNDKIEIKVIDSGEGVPNQLKDKIFQPLFTTKEIGKGTGLGLSISKNLLKQSGGDLFLDNLNEFTCFVMSIKHNREHLKVA